MKWKHDDLANDLADHLRGGDRLVWTDMQLGPAGSPRPDVYTVPLSFSKFLPVAYEVKISVADFRRDVTAGKYTSYLRYAAGVIFCVPTGLVGKVDIPHGCGLMTRSETGWRTVKGPTLRAVENLPRDAWIKLLIDGVGRMKDGVRVRTANQWAVEEKARLKHGETVAMAIRDHYMQTHYLAGATERLKKATHDADVEYERIIKSARERAERATANVDEARLTLARALGLAEDANAMTILARARGVAKRLDCDAEVSRLRQKLAVVQEALTQGLEPTPQLVIPAGVPVEDFDL